MHKFTENRVTKKQLYMVDDTIVMHLHPLQRLSQRRSYNTAGYTCLPSDDRYTGRQLYDPARYLRTHLRVSFLQAVHSGIIEVFPIENTVFYNGQKKVHLLPRNSWGAA